MYKDFEKVCKVCETFFDSWEDYISKTKFRGIFKGLGEYKLELRQCSCYNTLATEEISGETKK